MDEPQEKYVDPLTRFAPLKILLKQCEPLVIKNFDDDFSCGYEIKITFQRLVILVDNYIADFKNRIQRNKL